MNLVLATLTTLATLSTQTLAAKLPTLGNPPANPALVQADFTLKPADSTQPPAAKPQPAAGTAPAPKPV